MRYIMEDKFIGFNTTKDCFLVCRVCDILFKWDYSLVPFSESDAVKRRENSHYTNAIDGGAFSEKSFV